eukprot:566777-Hanusia_phi.AAC.2
MRGEDVTELRIGKLVHRSPAKHGEVAPDLRADTKVQLLDRPTGRSESSIGILCRDPRRDHVSLGGVPVADVKVNRGRAVSVWSVVKRAHVRDPVQGDAHPD